MKKRGNPNFTQKWRDRDIKTIRIPAKLEDILKEIAKQLDRGEISLEELKSFLKSK